MCSNGQPVGARRLFARAGFAATAAAITVSSCARSGIGVATGRSANEELRALSGTDIALYARVLQMADSRRADSAVVRSALESRARAVRVAGTLALGQIGSTSDAARLRALLVDRDTAVAATAAYALGLLRDSAAVGALGLALAAASSVAAEAAWALGQIGEPARAAIESGLAIRVRPPVVSARLLLAASKLRPVPARLTTSYFSHPDAGVRWAAIYTIARPYAPPGARAALALVDDPDAEIRAQTARALSKQAAGDSLASLALPLLARLSRDPDPHVRINAVRALGTHGTAGREPVVAATTDPDANVRIAAAQSLGTVLDAKRRMWLESWNADTSLMYRRSLLASALRVDLVLPAADEDNKADGWKYHPDWRYRAAVAEAGANAPSVPRIVEVSLPLVRDSDPRVRVVAYEAIAPYADSVDQHPWRREFMMPALNDWDYFVRATAINSLTTRASAAEASRVLASYRKALADSANDARIAAIKYLAAAWRRDSAAFTDSLRSEIASLSSPRDLLVSREAAGVSIFAHWADAGGTARPLGWYEERVRALIAPALVGRVPHADIVTERGTIVLELFAREAPLTVDNFVTLARSGYYDSIRFHRVVPNFVAQDGDARGDGNGSPGYTIRDELNRHRYERGAVGMALSGPDTGGSQYFLTLSPQPHLDGGYTVFGRVTGGFDAMDALVQGDRIERITIR